MSKLDDQMTVGGETTTLRHLAAEERLVLRRSDVYSPGGMVPTRQALWADLVDLSAPGTHGWEISEDEYAELLKLGVPEAPSE